jgi:glycosyltransferase involved in cell wall biosynthesis
MLSGPPNRLSICVISHASVVATNQALWAHLADHYPIELALLAPRMWRGLDGRGLKLILWAGLEGRVRPMTVFPRGHPNLHWWWGLGGQLASLRPNLVFLDEEPYSLAAWQTLCALRRLPAALVIYAKQNLCKPLPPPLRSIEKQALARADWLVAVEEGARVVLLRKGCTAPVSLLPHPIDTALYRPASGAQGRARLGLAGFVIGYVGRLVPQKGVLDLLEAARALRARGVGRFSLLLVGDGPQRPQLEAYAAAYLPGQVVFAGAVPHSEVPAYYNCMDVLVLPSRTTRSWQEQFGRVLLEAQACGVPVVGSDSGAIPRCIEMTAGLVFPEGDVGRLAEALERLLRDPAQRQDLARRGRERVLASFAVEAVAARLYDICRAAWDRWRSRRQGAV